MIKEDYCSLEVAKLLKEKGFNEPCRLYYDNYHGYVPIFVADGEFSKYGYERGDEVRNGQNCISNFVATAPALSLAMKWLREVYNIDIIAPPQFDSSKWTYSAIIFKLSIPSLFSNVV